ncbi:MAG: UDP-N-acetylmuramate:L-alanyl-gamma-D-glutamyl-meso-diaminopimelate ligase [Proteobacteria bacterium]|nr:UDP-N-acetylmuramate:L-alanyl-gamma-D-glutamyl-meso-diaminopimelate ligase [Pseudomonadota bacterium]
MRIHILGAAGTFMAGIARLAQQCGHTVSGSDEKIYPPMSTQLKRLGIKLYPNNALPRPLTQIDHFIVGNVMTRSMPAVEELLNSGLPYSSGPQWLYEHVLAGRQVYAVAGTHGKTTTASMLAWILRDNGVDAGFLIGGIPENFDSCAELGSDGFFVVEADEYDCAFFDKRPKFLHYRPDVLVLNNLEHDHVDIYPRLADLRRVFHQLLRQLPGQAQVIARADDVSLRQVIKQGIWSNLTYFNTHKDWSVTGDDDCLLNERGHNHGRLQLRADTAYNRLNALAATLAARHAGIDVPASLASLKTFAGVRRRLQRLHARGRTELYEDFAHHPTAVKCVIEAMNARVRRAGQGARLLVFIELGSYSMRSGHQFDRLLDVVAAAGRAWIYCPDKTLYNEAQAKLKKTRLYKFICVDSQIDALLDSVRQHLRSGDQLVMLSNRDFGGRRADACRALRQMINSLEK